MMNMIFTHSFNWWMVILLVGMLVVACVGSKQYRLTSCGVRRSFKDRFLIVVSSIFALPAWGLFIIESNRGVLQFFDNNRGMYETSSTSAMAAFFTLCFAGIIFLFALVGVGKVVSWVKLGLIVEPEEERETREVM